MRIALKIDVDTYRGIEDGATRLATFLHEQKIPASFFVSLGPDNSGWAATRVFRHKGFMTKMKRTSALSVYGWRTVLSGTLLPARPMGTSFIERFRQWRDWGFEVSPHGYDHILWHDEAASWNVDRAACELEKIVDTYHQAMGEDPKSFAAPGWQAGSGTWQAMEKMRFLYHSDTRGAHPYFPTGAPQGSIYNTLEIPTTLPTWDEMLAMDGITRDNIVEETFKHLKKDDLNVWTVHAEFEGTAYFPQFQDFIERASFEGVEWAFLPEVAKSLLEKRDQVPYDEIVQGNLPGRAGTVTCQHGERRQSRG